MRSEVWRPAVRLVIACSGGTGPARQALRPVPRGARCTRCGGNAADGSADPEPKNRHGGAPRGERPTLLDARRLASAWSAASWRAQPVLSAAPVRLSALRPPLDRGGYKFIPRAPSRRGNALGCLTSEDAIRVAVVQLCADRAADSVRSLSPPCGERVGVRGSLNELSAWRVPLTRQRKGAGDLSPQAGRGGASGASRQDWHPACPQSLAATSRRALRVPIAAMRGQGRSPSAAREASSRSLSRSCAASFRHVQRDAGSARRRPATG
jgi:hypothetical protein